MSCSLDKGVRAIAVPLDKGVRATTVPLILSAGFGKPFAEGLAATTFLFRHEITGREFDIVSLSQALSDTAESGTYLCGNRFFYDPNCYLHLSGTAVYPVLFLGRPNLPLCKGGLRGISTPLENPSKSPFKKGRLQNSAKRWRA